MTNEQSILKKTLVVTGSDSTHFDLTEDFILSFRNMYQDKTSVAFINFCDDPVTEIISKNFDIIKTHSNNFRAFDKRNGYFAAFNRIKPRLPDLFPGFECYCWIDSDCWFNRSDSLQRITEFSSFCDICIHPEYDIHYWKHPTPTLRTMEIYKINEATNWKNMPLTLPMVNAGVFAVASKSKLWKAWDVELQRLIARFEFGERVFFSDQIPLHKILHMNNMIISPILAVDNWQAYASIPIVHMDRETFGITLRPAVPPFDEIGILHLAGDTKDLPIKTAHGFEYTLRYRDMKKVANFYRGIASKL